MNTRTGRIALVAIMCLAASSAAGAQELYLNGTVVVAGESATWGSVGVVAGGGGPVAALLDTPLPELSAHPALVPARDLRNQLPKSLEKNLIIVGGPLLYLPKSITDEDERGFYTALLQDIEGLLPGRSLRVEVWATGSSTPQLSGLKPPLSFEFPSGSGSPRALASNRFIQYKGQGQGTYQYLPVHIRIEALVPVAKTSIAYGTRFAAAELTFRPEDISSLTGRTAPISGGLLDARSGIKKGQVVYADMVSKVYAISAGKRITISFRRGNVEVSVPGSAYQPGGLGDTISVAPMTTGTRFKGTIVSPTEVVVEE